MGRFAGVRFSRSRLLAFVALILVAAVLVVMTLPDRLAGPPAPERHVVAGGVLSFERPHDFGLAVRPEEVLGRSYIPPCEPGFDYCLYYTGMEYAGTNFESAGLRIQRREDLAGEAACLTTPPAGYFDLQPRVRRGDGFAVSTFAPVGDAAMGHYAEGKLFRLALASACYEFETRIGQSRFELYEPGSVKEFTRADKEALEARLHEVLSTVRLVDRPGVPLF